MKTKIKRTSSNGCRGSQDEAAGWWPENVRCDDPNVNELLGVVTLFGCPEPATTDPDRREEAGRLVTSKSKRGGGEGRRGASDVVQQAERTQRQAEERMNGAPERASE